MKFFEPSAPPSRPELEGRSEEPNPTPICTAFFNGVSTHSGPLLCGQAHADKFPDRTPAVPVPESTPAASKPEASVRRRGQGAPSGVGEHEEGADGWVAEDGPQEPWAKSKREGMVSLPSGLEYRPLRMAASSSSAMPVPETPCRCHYRVRSAANGEEFDCSYRTGSIILRPEQAIKGWSEALQMMRQGDRWELYIPSELAYGEKGFGSVPPNADLIVEVELTDVTAKEIKGERFEFGLSVRILIVTVLCIILVIYQHYGYISPARAREASAARPRGPRLHPQMLAGLDSNPRVFFEMEVNRKSAGRIEFELFSSVVPHTAENFRALATGERGTSTKSGATLHYKGSKFHRIIPGFMCQGGDFQHGNGEGGESIYGKPFQDEWEHGVLQHTMPGLLSMANKGADTNGAQFFITAAASPWLDDRHVVFGRVTRGMDVLKHLEAFGSKSGRPTEEVVIANSGQL